MPLHDLSHDYKLPLVMLDEHLTPADYELILALEQYPPVSPFKPGDHAILKRNQPALQMLMEDVPLAWEVRFVISQWAYHLFLKLSSYALEGREVRGLDHAISLVDDIPEYRYSSPVIYAHGWPHGVYPNTAAWFFNPDCLKRFNLRDNTQQWEHLLDEFRTPFIGYDPDQIPTSMTFDLAPMRYSDGQPLGRPLTHEEGTFHTACLLGLEEFLMTPIASRDPRRIIIDPEHDIFR